MKSLFLFLKLPFLETSYSFPPVNPCYFYQFLELHLFQTLEKNGILLNLRGVSELFLVLIMEYNVYVFILSEVLHNVLVPLTGNSEDKSIRVWDMSKR